MLAAGAWPCRPDAPDPSIKQAPPSSSDLAEIAVDAYTYAYPMVLMDVTRRVMTNYEAPDPKTGMGAPVNQFSNKRTFPDASFSDVVRPNADTLYSTLWFDVSKEPLVISVPDSGGRYYLLPMLDLWTDVFASPGTRTTGNGAQTFAIAGPSWHGRLPDGVELIRAPTPIGWMIGRTQTNGKSDYDAVHKFQDGLRATPLSAYGKPYTPPRGTVDPSISPAPPVEQVMKMDAATFFTRFCELVKDNPPHGNDYPILAWLKRIGIEPGRQFDFARQPMAVQSALTAAIPKAQARIGHSLPGTVDNGWLMVMQPVGTYGTDYLKRATIAMMGLGANLVEDAIYPYAATLSDGQPFDSARQYKVHFDKDGIPPARAFWSLTMYNDRQLFAANPIDRYAIGDRDKLQFNPDGSLDLWVQRDSPGPDKESNWLPAPQQGAFTINLRLYWPKPAALDGRWEPPEIVEVR